jgi:hypothetical protein
MCVRVIVIDVVPALAVWDSESVTIRVRTGVEWKAAHREVGAILADLGAPLPTRTGVLRCYCGDAIDLPAAFGAGSRRRGHDNTHIWQVSRGA